MNANEKNIFMNDSSLIRRVLTRALIAVALAVIGYRFLLPFTPPWIDVVFIALSVIILIAIWADRRKKSKDKN